VKQKLQSSSRGIKFGMRLQLVVEQRRLRRLVQSHRLFAKKSVNLIRIDDRGEGTTTMGKKGELQHHVQNLRQSGGEKQGAGKKLWGVPRGQGGVGLDNNDGFEKKKIDKE